MKEDKGCLHMVAMAMGLIVAVVTLGLGLGWHLAHDHHGALPAAVAAS